MSTNQLYYQESGVTPSGSLTKMLGIGLLVAIPLSALYSYIVTWMPIVHLSFLLTLFLGAIIGRTIGKVAHDNNVRNLKIVKGITIFVAIVAIYFAWVFTVLSFFKTEELTFNPLNIIAAMTYLADYGAWSVSNYTPKGLELYIVWLIEAGAILGTALYALKSGYGIAPYCEDCNLWNKEEIVTSMLSPIPIKKRSNFVKELEKRNFNVLTNLRNTTEQATEWMLVEIFNCPNCPKAHYLTIIYMTRKTGSKGQIKETFDTIIENLHLNEEEYLTIQAWRQKLNAVDSAVLDIDLESRQERGQYDN